MNTELDVTRTVRSWLRTDEHESADRLLDLVLDALDTTPQHRSWWPVGRYVDMNNFPKVARFAIAAAAVVVISIIGVNLLVSDGGSGPGGSAPSASPSSSPSASVVAGAQRLYRSAPQVLEAGEYLIDGISDRHLTVTVPDDWTGLENGPGNALLVKTVDGGAFGTVGNTVLLGIYAIDGVYADPCHDAVPASPAPTSVDDVVSDITHAVSIHSGPVTDAVVAGRPAKVFDLTNDINMDDCITQPFNQWSYKAGTSGILDNGTSSGQGDHQRIWVFDLDGTIVLVNADSGDNSVPKDVAELYGIVAALRSP